MKFQSLIVLVVCSFVSASAHAQEATVAEPTNVAAEKAEKVEPQIVKLAEGKLLLPVPGEWKVVKPRSRIVQHEFSVAAAEGDEMAGRMTIMAAGGGVQANIDRWVGQFQTAEGKPLGDDAKKIEEKKIGDQKVHTVDLTGNYQDSMRGPFGPKVNRPNYRMLAAIVPLKEQGTWFIKFYGPQATVKAAEKDFRAMVEGIKLAK